MKQYLENLHSLNCLSNLVLVCALSSSSFFFFFFLCVLRSGVVLSASHEKLSGQIK